MNNNDCGAAKSNETHFEILLRDLESAVNVSVENANTYDDLVNKVDGINLKCNESLKSDSKPSVEPNTIVFKLRTMINRLEFSNSKNSEIISNLKSLL